MPKKYPARWRPDLSCAFHQGAPGHDVEHCFSLKIEVQNLIEANVLSFEGSTPIVQTTQWAQSINMVQHYQIMVRDVNIWNF